MFIGTNNNSTICTVDSNMFICTNNNSTLCTVDSKLCL